jgi:nitronate monooxygenase
VSFPDDAVNHPVEWMDRLRVPAVAAPMTDVSGPELVAAACVAGVVGAFPAHNAADAGELDEWLRRIGERIAELAPRPGQSAPVAVNLVVHKSNSRLADDMKVIARHGVEVVVTSVGSPREIVAPLHDAGITVLADVATVRHARRAAEAGVDGLVLLTAGAGGQTGWANPFAFLRAVREWYDGIVVLAGGISDGAGLLAATVLGADLAYLGTRFIATEQSLASEDYRRAVVTATLDDVVTSTRVSGLAANVLETWLRGFEATDRAEHGEFTVDRLLSTRGVWAAGHSVSGCAAVLPVAALVERLAAEFDDARHAVCRGARSVSVMRTPSL